MNKDLFEQRLIELRGERSRHSVAKDLFLKDQTLEKYEKGETLPNIEKAVEIAQYYGVSTDYLLGLTDVKTTDTDIKAACEYTGLSEFAIFLLNEIYSEERRSGRTLIEYIDNMLVNDNFRNVIYNIDELAGQLVLLDNAVMFEKFISNIIKSDKWDINIKKAYLRAISYRYSLTAIDMLIENFADYSHICDNYANGVLSEEDIDSLLSYYSRAIEKRMDYIKYEISQKMIDVISEITSHRRLTDMDKTIELEQIICNMYTDKEITSEQQNDLLTALGDLANSISQ